ncbi:MAG: hypothetical protein QNJ65_23870 [Xenococcaceae cyanobacterium MO_234.B1]|nr:hypothetical protein [Xenococcaceae cyanobacterium MO_234.B1]
MKSINLIFFYSIVLAIVGIVETVAPNQAYSREQTVALCQGRRNTVRIYKQNRKLLMRAFDQRDRILWLNSPVTEEPNPEGTNFINIAGEQTVSIFVARNDNYCSITIGTQAPETGKLLIRGTTQGQRPNSGYSVREQRRINNALGSWGKNCQNKVLSLFSSNLSMADIQVEVGATFQQSIDAGYITYNDLRRDGASFNWSVPQKNIRGYCNTDGQGYVTEFKIF